MILGHVITHRVSTDAAIGLVIGSVIDGDEVSGAASLPGSRPDLGDRRRL